MRAVRQSKDLDKEAVLWHIEGSQAPQWHTTIMDVTTTRNDDVVSKQMTVILQSLLCLSNLKLQLTSRD